ncbi:MAG: AraC family transcriptional regulator [Oscillospiraceae bacterium]|nr:AraC family transcriptional regulator [Oscillospiraceae bacterium]
MNHFHEFSFIRHLDRLPIRVSTECLRMKDNYHMHEHIQLCYALSGDANLIVNGQEHNLTPGSCAFFLPYAAHICDSRNSVDTPVLIYISFRESFLTERGYSFFPYCGEKAYFEGHRIPEHRSFCGDALNEANFLIRSMTAEFAREKDMSLDRLAELLADFFRLSCSDETKKPASDILKSNVSAITEAVHYITENFSKKITIDEAARFCGMSRTMFTQNFKAVTGQSFLDFLMSVRMTHARIYYVRMGLSLDEVAEKTGLYNSKNLARVFKRYWGISPTQLLATARNRPHLPRIHNSIYDWLYEDHPDTPGNT